MNYNGIVIKVEFNKERKQWLLYTDDGYNHRLPESLVKLAKKFVGKRCKFSTNFTFVTFIEETNEVPPKPIIPSRDVVYPPGSRMD